MAVAGKSRHYHWQEIRLRHWVETARRCGFAGMEAMLDDLVAMTPDVIRRVRAKTPGNFPEPILNAILDGTQNAARRLGDELAQMKR
jgi:serine/threonine-protein kinase HipA